MLKVYIVLCFSEFYVYFIVSAESRLPVWMDKARP